MKDTLKTEQDFDLGHLPENIRNSAILTPGDLKLLASSVTSEVDPAFYDDNLSNIFQYYSLTPDDLELELHRYAQTLLRANEVAKAWQVLLAF